MEHVIGDFFVVAGIIYQYREGYSCASCTCMYKEENVCTDAHNEMGPCSRVLRHDGKDVYFVQVGEVDAPFVITSDMLKQ